MSFVNWFLWLNAVQMEISAAIWLEQNFTLLFHVSERGIKTDRAVAMVTLLDADCVMWNMQRRRVRWKRVFVCAAFYILVFIFIRQHTSWSLVAMVTGRCESRLPKSVINEVQDDTRAPWRHSGTPRRHSWRFVLRLTRIHWNTQRRQRLSDTRSVGHTDAYFLIWFLVCL